MAVPRMTKSDTQRKQNDILFYFLVRATYFFTALRLLITERIFYYISKENR